MNLKTLVLGIALLLVAHASPGQEVTKAQFEKAVDYVTCRFSQYSLEKNPTFSAQAAQFKEKCPCETATTEQVLAVLKPMGVNGTTLLATELASVKKGEIQRFERKKPEATTNFLTDGIFTATYPKNGKPTPKYTAVQKFKANLTLADLGEIRENVQALVTTGRTEESSDPDGSTEAATPEPPAQPATDEAYPPGTETPAPSSFPQKKPGTDWMDATIGLLFGLILGGGTVYFFSKKKKDAAAYVDSQKPFTGSDKMSEEAQRIARRDQEKISQLLKELEAVNAENVSLKAQLAALTPKSTPTAVPVGVTAVQNPTSGAASAATGVERYFSIPDLDERQRGYWFHDNGADGYRPHVSTYRLTPIGDGQTARFETANAAEAMSKLIGSRVSGVLPVCTELNAYHPEAKRINTKQPGTARREGDRWVVTEPAQIEYA